MKNRRILVKVLKADIKNGTTRDCVACPVALALKRVVRPDVTVIVGDSNMEFWFRELPSILDRDPNAHISVGTTRKVEKFVHDFDQGKKNLKPFQFCIILPEGFLRPNAPRI